MKNLKVWIGVVLSVGLLVYLFSLMDMEALWGAMKSVSPGWVLLIMALNLSLFYIRALRWRYLMDPVKHDIPVGSLYSATMIGFMANNVLPMRLGEFVRAYALGKKEGAPTSSVFATIVVERLFDGMSVLFLLIVTLVFLPEGLAGGLGGTLRKAGEFSIAAYIVIIGVMALSVHRPQLPVRWVGIMLTPISVRLADRLKDLVSRFVHGLGVIKNPALLGRIVFYTFVHWGLLPLTVYLLFVGMNIPFGIYEAVFIFTLICLGVALPSTPGFVGTYHAAATGGLVLLGLDKETALSFAIVSHAVGFLPVTLLGFYYLSKENLSLARLKELETPDKP